LGLSESFFLIENLGLFFPYQFQFCTQIIESSTLSSEEPSYFAGPGPGTFDLKTSRKGEDPNLERIAAK